MNISFRFAHFVSIVLHATILITLTGESSNSHTLFILDAEPRIIIAHRTESPRIPALKMSQYNMHLH